VSDPLPAAAPLKLYRGDTRIWTALIETNTGTDVAPVWVPYDLTNHTVLAQIRSDKNRTAPVVAAVATVVDADPTTGLVTLTLTSAEADKLGDDGALLWWDVQTTRTADSFRRTWLAGKVTVKGDVSNV
jgi:hypothetical protein